MCKICGFGFHDRCVKIDIKFFKGNETWECVACLRAEVENKWLNVVKSKDEAIKLLCEDIDTLKAEFSVLKKNVVDDDKKSYKNNVDVSGVCNLEMSESQRWKTVRPCRNSKNLIKLIIAHFH